METNAFAKMRKDFLEKFYQRRSPVKTRIAEQGVFSSETQNHKATQSVRNAAISAVMASGRPACFDVRTCSRDCLPSQTGRL